MAASLSGLSASVTRILSLTGFPKELKTKDIQSAFSDYEGMTGGFKIKWRDDTSLLIVFQDAAVGGFKSNGASVSLLLTCFSLHSKARLSEHSCLSSSNSYIVFHRHLSYYQTLWWTWCPIRHSDCQLTTQPKSFSFTTCSRSFRCRVPQCT